MPVLSPVHEGPGSPDHVGKMSFEFKPLQASTPLYRLAQGTLGQRLGLLLPGVDVAALRITTTELSGNASFVNYVRHHHLEHPAMGAVLDVVEKSIRKVAFISSLEARFYRERQVLEGSVHFQHPACYGLMETPWESIIFTRFVQGRAPRMHAIATRVAKGIAELEQRSAAHLAAAPPRQRFKYWQMDFFRPWYLLRPRFNYARHFRDLRALAAGDARFNGLQEPLRALIPVLRHLARTAQASPRCFSHMDYLRKNLFVSPEGLQLIDWSEVKVGRIGFDAGSYLSGLLRRRDMASYAKAQDEFVAAYSAQVPEDPQRVAALENMRYVLLLNSLWHFLRPETAQAHRARDQMPLLREKLDYLIEVARTPSTNRS